MARIEPRYDPKSEQALMTELWDPTLHEDVLAFVKFIFPWGQENTPLAKYKGPRSWQCEELERITDHIKQNKERMKKGENPQVYRSSTASGRGVGKSALSAWLNIWHMTAHLGASGVTTANTESQLKSITWAELGKWHTLSLNSHWFEKMALGLRPADWFKELLENDLKINCAYYYAEAKTWSEERTDAFAGMHSDYGMMVIFDEASGIPKPIWGVTEGFFTDPTLHRYWFCFSNPRRNTGEFFETFHSASKYWKNRNLDSRTVEGTDKFVLNQIIEKNGIDSDEARIEVRGMFPRQGDQQFISRETVDGAVAREIEPDPYAPLIMGVDVARFGDDSTVLYFRRGRDARSIDPVILKGKDNMEVANECAFWIDELNPDAVAVDAGNGTGVIDRLREMGYKTEEIWFGSKADSPEWTDTRTEIWAKMRDWLRGGCIQEDKQLINDLVGPIYEFDKQDRIKLESKEKMKKRGIMSPDRADALAVTFAVSPARKDRTLARRNKKARIVNGIDFPVF